MRIVIAISIAIVVIIVIAIVKSKDNKQQAKLTMQPSASKQDLEILKTQDAISFRLSGKLFQQISDWEFSIDEMVFKEQLQTGSFRGKYPVDGIILEVMKPVEKEGRILPYYGAGGSRGIGTYYFRSTSSGFAIQVEHTVTEEHLVINVSSEEIGTFINKETIPRFKYSPMPYLVDEKLPEEWSKIPDNEIIFRIAGKEYQSLAEWENWAKEQAFTSRYVYQFGLVSMGAGYTMAIEDTGTNSTINVTDYDSW
ncbi:MAG: hypothetical protein GY832_34105 [Chloroflexi bacterium]|nr:hypothetical protein [Chloroflexota bacterium]